MGGGQVVKEVLDDRRTHCNSELNRGDVKLGWVEQCVAKHSIGEQRRGGEESGAARTLKESEVRKYWKARTSGATSLAAL